MKARNLIWLVSLLVALPVLAQEQEHRIHVETRVLGPGSAVFISEDGEETRFSPSVEVIGDGSHYFQLLGHRRQIGVQLTGLTPELREHFGVDSEVGVMVSKVSEGKPAEAAGVEVGDIITAVDGDDVASSNDLVGAIRSKDAGEYVELEIWRDGRRLALEVAVEESEPPRVFRWSSHGDGDERHKLVLPEIRLRSFDSEQFKNFTGEWQGTIELEDIQGVLEHLGELFESEDWKARLHQIEEMDFGEVEEKMKRVEERLRTLERELEKE